MNTAGAIAQALAEAGIKKAFGLPGGEVLVLIDELRKVGIDFVLMRHEANAGIAAAVYGKLNRQPGVVIATLGPGAANLLRPMANPAARAADLRARCAMAKRPLVLVGLGADPDRAPALRRWLDAWQLPFAVTPKVKGLLDETSPNFVGVISGMAADGVMVDA